MPNDCFLCGWRNGGHNENCPRNRTDDWEKGYRDGRSGQDAQNDEPVYKLGYGRGVIALEEYENGYDPRFD